MFTSTTNLAVFNYCRLIFTEATEHYLKLRSVAATPGAISARYIRPNTEQDYRQKLGAGLLFFGEMTLGEIH